MNDIMNISGVSCYEQDGTAYLRLEDVARGLGFVDNSKGPKYIRWNTVKHYLMEIGFSQEVAKDGYIPENIFYRLAMKAKNETAEKFQALVADEIIPAIRKTGVYAAPIVDSTMMFQIAQAMQEKERQIQQLSTENECQRQAIEDFKPAKEYLDTILASPGTMATTQIAADYGMSAIQLNGILHGAGVQHNVNGQWILYRKHMGKGLTKSKTIPITHRDGTPDTKVMTQWTQKGRLMIYDILKERGIIAVMDQERR